MPIYEYQCQDCGYEFETIQKISEDPLTTCPNCNKDGLIKKISAAGFRLKGGGWYETDFKGGGRKNVSGDSGSSSGDSASSDKPAKSSDSGGSSSAKSDKSSGSSE